MKRLLVALALIPSLSHAIPPATAAEAYDLQERCAKSSAQRFKEGYFGGGVIEDKDGRGVYSYTTHYSLKTNRCLQIISVYYRPKKGKPYSMKQLWDVNENDQLGAVIVDTRDDDTKVVTDCYIIEKNVKETDCKTEGAWDTMTDAIMTE